MTENRQDPQANEGTILPTDREEQAALPEPVEDTAVPEEATAPDRSNGPESVPAEDEAAGTGDLMENDDGEGSPDVARLADEFLRLAEEIPSITQPEDLPDEVWDTAAQGIPLRDAYLRFWFAEWSRGQEAASAQTRAASGSAGSLRDVPDDPRPEEAAFTRSFQTSME